MSLVQSSPRFSPTDAATIAAQHYRQCGIPMQVVPLASERDQNFLLTIAKDQPALPSQKGPSTAAYVLKIANAQEEAEILDLQNRALAHLAATSTVPVPQLVNTAGSEPLTKIRGSAGEEHWVRLLTFLPGKPLGEVRPHTPALFHNLGVYLGEL
ncbi:MAG: phosphotransferase, partial [Caldilineaceae bacterium]|nr:phosphotransferase [Caldilineaceae bacterium]